MPDSTVFIENYRSLNEEIAKAGAKLIAVSKTHPIEKIESFYAMGHRDFGENRVQEVLHKQSALPNDIRWHFIGHLQRNKVKQIAPFISLIHSVDSLRLLREINKEAAKNDRIIDVLLQFHVAKEESKFGLDLAAAQELLQSEAYHASNHVRVVGVMGMATFTDQKEQVIQEFEQLRKIFNALQDQFFPNESSFKEISMGMSGDYPLALERGSTMVRVGSRLFGARH